MIAKHKARYCVVPPGARCQQEGLLRGTRAQSFDCVCVRFANGTLDIDTVYKPVRFRHCLRFDPWLFQDTKYPSTGHHFSDLQGSLCSCTSRTQNPVLSEVALDTERKRNITWLDCRENVSYFLGTTEIWQCWKCCFAFWCFCFATYCNWSAKFDIPMMSSKWSYAFLNPSPFLPSLCMCVVIWLFQMKLTLSLPPSHLQLKLVPFPFRISQLFLIYSLFSLCGSLFLSLWMYVCVHSKCL